MSEALKNQGLEEFRVGKYEAAAATFQQAAESYAASGDPLNQAEMLNNLGIVFRFLRRYPDAHAAFETGHTLLKDSGDTSRLAQILGNWGDLHAQQKNREKANALFSEAADLFAQQGDRTKQAQTLRALSLFQLRQRRWVESLVVMRESLSVNPRRGLGNQLFLWLIKLCLGIMGRVRPVSL